MVYRIFWRQIRYAWCLFDHSDRYIRCLISELVSNPQNIWCMMYLQMVIWMFSVQSIVRSFLWWVEPIACWTLFIFLHYQSSEWHVIVIVICKFCILLFFQIISRGVNVSRQQCSIIHSNIFCYDFGNYMVIYRQLYNSVSNTFFFLSISCLSSTSCWYYSWFICFWQLVCICVCLQSLILCV
jgi:hypothetical protein